MPTYDKPTKILMRDFAKAMLKPGQVFHQQLAIDWFAKRYPKLNRHTVWLHVDGMAVNNISRRRNNPGIKPKSDHDLFWKIGRGQFRLWDPKTDPKPVYKPEIDAGGGAVAVASRIETEDEPGEDDAGDEATVGSREFAFERDLKNYLSKNLGSVEKGLKLYEDEGLTGIEFPVGGRFIDILAEARDGALVVIELKVSRGYDRTLGQLMRYMGWIRENLAGKRKVRGIIVASGITDDLKMAAWAPDVKLVEYEISFKLKPVA